MKALQTSISRIWVMGSTINFSDSVRNLGLILDKNMNFEAHVIKKCSLSYMKLKNIYKFNNVVSADLKWKLVNSVVLTHVDYCSSVYYQFLDASLKRKVQVLQNSAFRFSFHVPRRSHITPFYVSRDILKIEYKFTLYFLTYLYKIILMRTPAYLFDLLTFRKQIHNVNVRGMDKLTIPAHSSQKFKGSFQYLAAKLYNEFADVFQKSGNLVAFRRAVFVKLLEKQNADNV